MGLIGCPETSVTNYHSVLPKSQKKASHLHRDGSLKSRMNERCYLFLVPLQLAISKVGLMFNVLSEGLAFDFTALFEQF
jgi:hypothetical protein